MKIQQSLKGKTGPELWRGRNSTGWLSGSLSVQPKVNPNKEYNKARSTLHHLSHQPTSRVCSIFGLQNCKRVVLVECIDGPL